MHEISVLEIPGVECYEYHSRNSGINFFCNINKLTWDLSEVNSPMNLNVYKTLIRYYRSTASFDSA